MELDHAPLGADLSTAALQALNDLLWALPSTLDPYAIVAVVLERVARLFDAPLAGIWLKEGGEFTLAGGYGFTDKKAELLWERLELSRGDHAAVLLQGPALHQLGGFGKRRLGAVMALPFGPVGVQGWLVVARLEPRPFTDFEREFGTMLVDRIAVAIDAALRYQATETRSRELELLYEIAQLLVSTVRLDELLARLVRRMVESFQLSGCLIGLVEPSTGDVPPVALYLSDPAVHEALEKRLKAKPLRIDAGRTREVLRLKAPYVTRSVQDDPLVFPALKEVLGQGSLIAAPLTVRSRAVGILYWFRAGKQRPLTEAMMPLVTHLANQVAIALDNAQLVHHMEQQIAERTEAGRAYVTGVAQQVRGQIHNILGLAGLIQDALAAPAIDREKLAGDLDRIMDSAEATNDTLEELFQKLRDGDRFGR